MTGALISTVQLPTDSTNTGKLIGHVRKVVGGDQHHHQQVVQERREAVTGIYRAASVVTSINATAQNGTSTGFAWLFLDSAATVAARLRKLRIEVNHSSVAAAMPTIPTFTLARITHIGTPTGAALASVRCDTTYPVAQADLRTAATGLTPVLAGAMTTAPIMPLHLASTVGIVDTLNQIIDLVDINTSEDEWPVIRPGEGVVLYQNVAGTATDTRRFTFNMLWDEFAI